MFGIHGPIGTVLDLLVVVLGFGLIVFLHECGHFFAARWAGIRVLAFALGFGPAVASYRKGMGLRRGTTEPAYRALLIKAEESGDDSALKGISPTEYRFNALPLGGYVKMLGQDDLDPCAVSKAPDSYQNCKPWKRMVVISAGVVMNIITAAVLFVAVFMIGLKVEPPVVGGIAPGSPAAQATPLDAGIETVGLEPGDTIASINGRPPNTFADVRVGVAMTARDTPVELLVDRPGVDAPLRFEVVPEVSAFDGLLSIGIDAPMSLTISPIAGPDGDALPESTGLKGVTPGSRIVAADDAPISTPAELDAIFAESNGQPVAVTIETDSQTLTRTINPRADMQIGIVPGSDEAALTVIEHLLGLTPVIRIADRQDAVTEQGIKAGLEPGDIFASLDGIEFPSLIEGIRRIRASRGRDISIVVLREVDGVQQRVTLTAPVSSKGRIGFAPDDTASLDTLVALPPLEVRALDEEDFSSPPAAEIITAPGQRIVLVNGEPVANFTDIRNALQRATIDAAASGTGATVDLTIELPIIDANRPRTVRQWHLSAKDITDLHALSWSPPFNSSVFEPEQIILKASGPGQAISFGLSETRRVLVMTYVTFARLFERTVKIEHLKGPVGIAHIGTLLAGRGFVWVMFFMAVISVNLAVINFLPLPIVDGGQFLMLVYEQIRGRPVPIAFQNVVTMAGLLLIVSLFLVVTFNDVRNLLGF
jgi:regulator of sigma E protease